MKFSFLLILTLVSSQSISQKSSIYGIVSIQNSLIETGKRQYVVSAQVRDNFGKAQPTITDLNGRFKLNYIRVPENSSVSFSVIKPGLTVVNIDALNAITNQRDTIRISMASEDKLAEYRRKIYQVGKTEAEKKLERILEMKSSELLEVRRNDSTNTRRIEDLENELAKFSQQKEPTIEMQAQQLANTYALINLDDQTELFRKAFALFQDGDLDSALQILNESDLVKKAQTLLANRESRKYIRNTLNAWDSTDLIESTNLLDALSLKADLYLTRYEWEEASACFQLMIKLDSTNSNTSLKYADFFSFEGLPDSSIKYYLKYLETSHTPLERSAVYSNLALEYLNISQLNKAEEFLQKAFGVLVHSPEDTSIDYEYQVTGVLVTIGIVYARLDFKTAEQAYLEALKHYQHLMDRDSSFKSHYALTLNNLGVLYMDIGDTLRAKPYLLEALEIRKALAQQDAFYERDLAVTLLNVGLLYNFKKDFKKSESALLTSLEIRKKLFQKLSISIAPELADSYKKLAVLYSRNDSLLKEKEALFECEKIFRMLVEKNIRIYAIDLGLIKGKLCEIYTILDSIHTALNCYEATKRFYKNLYSDTSRDYRSNIASLAYTLGLQLEEKDAPRCLKLYEESDSLYYLLSLTDTMSYQTEIAHEKLGLGMAYGRNRKYIQAEKTLKESISRFEKLPSAKAHEYNFELALAFLDLGGVYAQTNKFEVAEINYIQAKRLLYEIYDSIRNTKYEVELAHVKDELCFVHAEQKRFAIAEVELFEAIEIYERLLKVKVVTDSHYLLKLQNDLNDFYQLKENYYTSLGKGTSFYYTNLPSHAYSETIHYLNTLYSYLIDSSKSNAEKLQWQYKMVEACKNLYEINANNDSVKQNYVQALNKLSWFELLTSEFSAAYITSAKGLLLDSSQYYIKIKQAHALLLLNHVKDAMKIYISMRSKRSPTGETYSSIAKKELNELWKAGVVNKHRKKILKILK